ncbi:MAG: hypothetical protein ACI88A_000842 [Paraglaciecola sp.]
MRILYGVQGTGNGHITRARVMASGFAKRDDVKVDFLFSGRDSNKYFDMEVFGQYRSFEGLSFIVNNGCIDRWETLKSAKLSTLIRDIRQLDLSAYDLVINDFEPISAWAAKLIGIPSISISHQAAFTHPIPMSCDNLFDRFITKFFAPAKIQLGVHWYHFGQAIMPPFIQIPKLQGVVGKHLLVYLPFEDIDTINNLLETLSEHDFICFHPAIESLTRHSNITWLKPSKDGFSQALQTCSGVIANAGFELASESLHLGKKLLLKPLDGQFEQLSNAVILSQIGLCHIMHAIDPDTIEEWLHSPPIEAIMFPSKPDILIEWLLDQERGNITELCNELWQQVHFPHPILQLFEQLTE